MSLWGTLRSHLVRCLGSRERVLREVFSTVESRGDAETIKALLGRSVPATWTRSWADQQHDPQLLWESTEHALPDGRTPLMCALLATPRYLLMARLREEPEMLRRLARHAPGSLAGTSAAGALSASGECWGEVARSAVQEWRGTLAAALLAPGGSDLARQADHAGRTALHYAAWAGDAPAAAALLRAGADAGALDRWARSAAHVAAARGQVELAGDLAARCPRAAAERDAFGHTVSDMLRLNSRGAVEERSGLSGRELFHDFVALSRPVLVRGGCAHLPAMSSWAEPQRLVSKLGTATLSAGQVPYAPDCTAVTLPAFLASAAPSSRSCTNGRGPQAYAFDASVTRRCPALLADAEIILRNGWDQFAAYARQPQFGLGFSGAGAPMHLHHAALNALFVGSKRWYLLPPEAGLWRRGAPAAWAASPECAALRARGALLELRQHAGDLLFVPEGWGHATVLEEYSVGVGQEFVPLSSMSS